MCHRARAVSLRLSLSLFIFVPKALQPAIYSTAQKYINFWFFDHNLSQIGPIELKLWENIYCRVFDIFTQNLGEKSCSKSFLHTFRKSRKCEKWHIFV